MLLKLPGINSKNAFRVLNGVRDLEELTSLSAQALEEVLENAHNARLLHTFLHRKYTQQTEPGGPIGGARGRGGKFSSKSGTNMTKSGAGRGKRTAWGEGGTDNGNQPGKKKR